MIVRPKRNIIIVNDNFEAAQELGRQIARAVKLHDPEIEIRVFKYPEEALGLLNVEQNVNILISDLNFEGRGMTGNEFVKKIRQEYPQSFIIVYSNASKIDRYPSPPYHFTHEQKQAYWLDAIERYGSSPAVMGADRVMTRHESTDPLSVVIREIQRQKSAVLE